MSILIKDLDMPKHCADNCPLMDNGRCWGVKNQPEPVVIAGHRPSWCPLVEVKTPHGRLIDANKAIEEEVERCKAEIKNWPFRLEPTEQWKITTNRTELFKKAPTVIEAER